MSNELNLNMDSIKIDKGIISLQSKLGLPANFFKDLLDENDWSFIIKLHALLEGACSQLLVFHFNEPKLDKIFSRLELSDAATGKLAFLRELGLIGSDRHKYIVSLSQFRNKLVHNVQYYNADLKKMVSDFDKNQKKSFALAFSPFESTIRRLDKIDLPKLPKRPRNKDLESQIEVGNVIKRFEENPKVHIWSGAYDVLISIVDMHGYSDFVQCQKANKLIDEDRELL